MQEKLIIYLHANDLTVASWAILEANGTIRQHAYRDQFSGLAQIAEDKMVIVIVPAEDVLLTMATLPVMARSRLLQAVPYALEDELIDEVENLHFAVGEQQADGNVPVAIVSREKMQQWLSLLQSSNIKAEAFVPASLALPFENHTTWYARVDDIVVLRTSKFHGFVCDRNNLTHFLEGENTKEMKFSEEQMVCELAKNISDEMSITLLQGPYAIKKSRFLQLNKIWKITTYLALAWVVLLFLYPTVSYFILKQRVNHIENQITQIYKRNFPQSSSIVAPKLRMQEKMQKLNNQMGDNRLLLLLGSVGKGVSASSGVKLKRFDFQNNQLTLDLTAASSEEFSAFTDYLTQQGLNVKQQSANLSGTRINATVVVE